MVPIHESDVAENRWKDADWRQFELWEQIEVRLKRKRTWTILAVVFVFFGILSIPIIRDRFPKWTALRAMRELAVRANEMKLDAASFGKVLRMRIEDSETGPLYVIEHVSNCLGGDDANQIKARETERGSVFKNPELGRDYRVIGAESAVSFGLERVTQTFCYDPTSAETAIPGTRALGILTVNDLAESRLDRIAFLNFSGLFAEIDFD